MPKEELISLRGRQGARSELEKLERIYHLKPSTIAKALFHIGLDAVKSIEKRQGHAAALKRILKESNGKS